jgi:hypothetical protein
MNFTALTLALFSPALLGQPATASLPPLYNLDFSTATLETWEGKGFYVTAVDPLGPGKDWGVCSSDGDTPGRKAMLRRVFTVPKGAGVIRFHAYAAHGVGCPPSDQLDVVLLAAGKRVIPKKVLKDDAWVSTAKLRGKYRGQPREYMWDITNYVGQQLQIVLIDQDERPGCHVFCGGFRHVSRDQYDYQEFAKFMLKLEYEHKLPPLQRFESKHFICLSNTEDEFTMMRLRNCELIYNLFLDHFYRRGFPVREPGYKMMVAAFDSQSGFEAHIGQRMPAGITGVYMKDSNRLVIYDINRNNFIVAKREHITNTSRHIFSDLDRMRYVETEGRKTRELANDVNISTTMHEVAHQLSFNCGLLNREGDVPLWLAEGLACYCESTRDGNWQGVGEPNPDRIDTLSQAMAGRFPLLKLETLIDSDLWMRDAASAVAAYAESWALFRMLMEERPQEFRKYINRVYTRKSNGFRLADFQWAFGKDLQRFELRFQEYLRELVLAHPPRPKR